MSEEIEIGSASYSMLMWEGHLPCQMYDWAPKKMKNEVFLGLFYGAWGRIWCFRVVRVSGRREE